MLSRLFSLFGLSALFGSAAADVVLTSNDGTVRYIKFAPSEKVYGIDWKSLSKADCNILAKDIGQSAATVRPYTLSDEIPMGCCSSDNVIYWGEISSVWKDLLPYILRGWDFYDGYTALAQPPATAPDSTASEMLASIQREQGC